jgi:hypothetical protein
MEKLSKQNYLLGGFGFLLIWHLIMSRPWSPGGADGYWVVFVKGGFHNFSCGVGERIEVEGGWSYAPCEDNWQLIDGAIPPLISTFIFVGLAAFSFVRAYKSPRTMG